jgi:hypothetical protein
MRGETRGQAKRGPSNTLAGLESKQLDPLKPALKQNGQKQRVQGKQGRGCECCLPTIKRNKHERKAIEEACKTQK